MTDRAVSRTLRLTRREMLAFLGIGAAAALTGCATDPVTGKSTLVLMSEQEEIQLDRQQSPHQFSADYGPLLDRRVNAYVNQVGMDLASRSHRPGMPYSFRGVNAAYINAYAFPGGSIAATRGILSELNSEAELAALLGHEIGHVNARHAAEQATSNMLMQAAVVTGTLVTAASDYSEYAGLVSALGSLGGGALLAHYSRDNEREADALGMEYMTRAGYSPKGMVDLMELLTRNGHSNPSAIELMFATHPMSSERLATARERATGQYGSMLGLPEHRQRYMDHTARLRAQKPLIKALQEADKEMRQERFPQAEQSIARALRHDSRDYAALVMMAKCELALNRPDKARHYSDLARRVYPGEAQALYVEGVSLMLLNRPDQALHMFSSYEQALPGNPEIVFYRGLCLEAMGRAPDAAMQYTRFLGAVQQGPQAQHAYQRLRQWGYAR